MAFSGVVDIRDIPSDLSAAILMSLISDSYKTSIISERSARDERDGEDGIREEYVLDAGVWARGYNPDALARLAPYEISRMV